MTNLKTEENMNNNLVHQEKILARIQMLREKKEEVLALPPDAALNAILDTEHPAAVIHSFSDDDFYFLIKDIGKEDSVLLLSLASNRQWESLLDIEVWNRDRLDITSVAIWMDLFLAADANRCIKLFVKEKTEFFELFLYRNIEVKIREHDEDPSDFDSDFFTIDDIFYVRIIENIDDFNTRFEPVDLNQEYKAEEKTGASFKEVRSDFLHKLLKQLAFYDHVTYQNILLESASFIPSEVEEETYRLRNIRMAERGFIPFEEAAGIYKPLNIKNFNKNLKKCESNGHYNFFNLPLSIYPVKFLDEDNLFTSSLRIIKEEAVFNQISSEFAGIANQIISADQILIESREALRNIVKKGCGYINIGLEYLTKGKGEKSINSGAALLQNYTLTEIFRLGYGLSMKLKWKTEKWHRKSWFAQNKLSLSFWDEKGLGVLGGLFLKKPLYFDNYETGVSHREFKILSDVEQTAKEINRIIEIDNLFSLMKTKIGFTDVFFTYKSLLLTLWAKASLGFPNETEKIEPVDIQKFKPFFKDLWQDNSQKKIKNSVKEKFVTWISEATERDSYDITMKFGDIFENLFFEIEDNLGGVLSKDLDSRYIQLFLVKNKK